MELFGERDLQILAQLEFCPNLMPVFDPDRYCLNWADEYALGLSPEGDALLNELWSIRGYLHFSRLYNQRFCINQRQKEVWTAALVSNLPWHGTKRILLKPEDELFLTQMYEVYDRPAMLVEPERHVA